MVRKNGGVRAKVVAKKDVVQSRTISGKLVGIGAILGLAALFILGARDVAGKESAQPSQAELVVLYRQSEAAKEKAHYWAHKRKAGHRYHMKLSPMTSSLSAEETRLTNWASRAKVERMAYLQYAKEEKAKLRRLEAANRNLHLALQLASKHYGVSYQWLHACAHSEGHTDGWRPGYREKDPFIMNHQGSGAGGWLQFMSPTFYGNLEGASPVPKKYHKWNSRVGQAYVAAYMFKIGQSRQWTGAGCN